MNIRNVYLLVSTTDIVDKTTIEQISNQVESAFKQSEPYFRLLYNQAKQEGIAFDKNWSKANNVENTSILAPFLKQKGITNVNVNDEKGNRLYYSRAGSAMKPNGTTFRWLYEIYFCS